MIKAVFFDFDGTLMNTLPGIAHFGNAALAEVGLRPVEEDKYRYFVGNGRNKLIHRMLDFYKADTEENYEKAGKKYDSLYEADVMYGSVVYDGIPTLLDALKKDGIKCAMLSNKPDNVAQMLIEKNFGGKFDICFGQRQGIPTKPNPQAALEIAEKLNVKAEECLFVGDTVVDVTTGKNAGMYTCGVLWGFRDKEELLEADYIASVPDDIYKAVKNVK